MSELAYHCIHQAIFAIPALAAAGEEGCLPVQVVRLLVRAGFKSHFPSEKKSFQPLCSKMVRHLGFHQDTKPLLLSSSVKR